MQVSHGGLYVIVSHYLLDGWEIAAILDHKDAGAYQNRNRTCAPPFLLILVYFQKVAIIYILSLVEQQNYPRCYRIALPTAEKLIC
jgi:hypothetical protein